MVQRLRILEFTIDHEAPYFSKMRRRTSRKDSDLNGIVDVRYTGGARMLLLIEVGQGRWRFKVRLLSQSQSPPGTCLAIVRLPPLQWVHSCRACIITISKKATGTESMR